MADHRDRTAAGRVDGVRHIDPIQKGLIDLNLGGRDLEIDEVSVPSPDFPNGQRFGPVTLESGRVGPIDVHSELPVTFAMRRRRVLGVDWYAGTCHARGVFTVRRDRISLVLTAPVVVDRAAWWRRFGYWVFARPPRTTTATPDALGRPSHG
jgi:hypothetical protein